MSASSFLALVLFGVAAAFCAFTPHMMKPSVASKLAEAFHPVACPPQWLPVLLAATPPGNPLRPARHRRPPPSPPPPSPSPPQPPPSPPPLPRCSSVDQHPTMTLKSWYMERGERWHQCEELCRADPRCQSWMGRNSGNTCYLSVDSELNPNPSPARTDHHPHTLNAANCLVSPPPPSPPPPSPSPPPPSPSPPPPSPPPSPPPPTVLTVETVVAFELGERARLGRYLVPVPLPCFRP